MELPFDHFRLLGVSPTTDAQSVLRTLEQRLNRVPDDGFTSETLQAREALLRDSADLLTDSSRRETYESELTAGGGGETPLHGLKIPSHRELGGLLLLLEAGQPLECFELARRGLQPPQAPTLGSGRETDLCRLAALAALAGAVEQQAQRHYEAAARTLLGGLQLLQRMGQHPSLRQELSDELLQLRPFRVLDLLSRNLAASDERAEGLALLEELVADRGGLEGEGDTSLTAKDFQRFFQQIRDHLTVQEQIDLFSRWASASPAADFVASTALTAAGFAQRKPERIAEAKQRLEASGLDDVQPLLACHHLLLGQVEAAQRTFQAAATGEMSAWAAKQSDDPLGQVCAWCSDWLARDVLPHYRDLEADPDLEAYFADRDVQAYIERLSPPPPPAAAASPGINPFQSPFSSTPLPPLDGAPSILPPPLPTAGMEDDEDDELDWPDNWMPPWPAHWRLPSLPSLPALPPLPSFAWPPGKLPGGRRGLVVGAAVAAGVLGLGLIAVLRPRPAATPLVVEAPKQAVPTSKPVPAPAGPEQPAKPAPAASTTPLRSQEPSAAELQSLLERWLGAKASILAGKDNDQPLETLARPVQVARLEQERRDDSVLNETQTITAVVEGVTIAERGPNRIVVDATIRYSDQRKGADGQALGAASQQNLRNRYVFGRDDGIWRLASFGQAP